MQQKKNHAHTFHIINNSKIIGLTEIVKNNNFLSSIKSQPRKVGYFAQFEYLVTLVAPKDPALTWNMKL